MNKINVLIIEDDDDFAFLMQDSILEELNAEVVKVSSGKALKKTYIKQADVILLDYNLPDVSGTNLLQRIRPLTDVPVIIITGDKSLQTAVNTLKEGASEFLIKSPETIVVIPRVVQNEIEKFQREQLLKKEQHEKEILAAKIETLQQVLTTLAHYINNSTTTIFGYAQLCDGDEQIPPRCKKLAKISLKETKKITLVLKELENFVTNMEIKTTDYVNIPDAMFAIEENIKKNMEKKQ